MIAHLLVLLYLTAIHSNNRLYTAKLENTCRVRWTYKASCCVKAVAVQRIVGKVKIIGVGTNTRLYVKETLSSPRQFVSHSGSVSSFYLLCFHFLQVLAKSLLAL